MLEQVLWHIHNRFDVDRTDGEFTIEGGGLELDLMDNQYFWVEGSVFNDGLHQYPADDLEDETFTGTVYALAIPKAVIELANEIEDWVDDYGTMVDSPLQSESFGGYSYTKGSVAGSNGDGSLSGWQAVFARKLTPWRKLCNW